MDEGNDILRYSCQQDLLSTFKRMETFRNNSQLCDVTLVAGDKRIRAHRVIMAGFSDYFDAMFNGDLAETVQDVIHIRDVDPDALAIIVEYAYTADLEIRVDNVENLLSVACLLQVGAVREQCCDFMKQHLHSTNCLGIRAFAEAHGCDDLFLTADKFTKENFLQVIESKEFPMINGDQLVELFASDDLNVNTEEEVFASMERWVQFDIEKRKPFITNLLQNIRLPLMNCQLLTDRVERSPIFSLSEQGKELLLEAMKYHLLPERRAQMQSIRTRPRKSNVGLLYVVGGVESYQGNRNIKAGNNTEGSKGAISIECYNLRRNAWSSVATIGNKRLQFGVAVLDDKLFIVGGRDGLKTLNTVDCFDPHTKERTAVTPMNIHRHGLGVGVLGGPLYAVGGHDGWSYLNSVERYDPQTRQWSFVAAMSTSRSTVGVAVLDGKLYAVGGRDGCSCLNSAEVYDPHTNKWTMISSMIQRRGGVGVTVLDGFLYAVGGHDAPASQETSRQFDSIERYDPKTDQWTMLSPMLNCRDAVGASWLGNKIYAIGGYDGTKYLNDVECYDPVKNEWQQVKGLNTGRAGACVIVIPPSNRSVHK